MTETRIELPWWPPDPNEPIGTDRARQLVAALRLVARPVVDAAEADLRSRLDPDTGIVRRGAPLHYLARVRFGLEMRSVCVGTVYQAASGDALQNSIQLHRDGVLRWRRDGTAR
jgi:hypothetical protein